MLSTACICTSQQPSHSDTQAWEGRGGALRQHTPEHSSFMGSLHWSSTTLQQPSAAGQGVLAFLPADLFTGVPTLPRRITQGYNLTKLWDGRNVQWPEGDVSVISVQLSDGALCLLLLTAPSSAWRQSSGCSSPQHHGLLTHPALPLVPGVAQGLPACIQLWSRN